MKKILFLLLLALPAALFAQQYAVLEYVDDIFEIQITDASGGDVFADYGIEIEPGSTIQTFNSAAELRLANNGSILKLDYNTTFTIENLQQGSDDENIFELAAGTIRAVAARASSGNRYTFRTPNAVCGVRGTDFGMDINPGAGKEEAFVLDGLIDYSKKGGGPAIQLGAGQMANALGDVFQPMEIPAARMAQIQQQMGFQQLSPNDVPGHAEPLPPPAESDGATEQESTEEPQTGGDTGTGTADASAVPAAESGAGSGTSTLLPAAGEPGTTVTEEGQLFGDSDEPGFMDPIFDWLADVLGMEIGTITLNGKMYSKAVLQPTFSIGKLRMSLYLPIIYTNDMLDPSDWYRPAGNDEWSFGTDQTETWDIVQDIASDLALKIRFIEYGNQGWDDFYFKVGNLSTMSIGHGSIMKNYANDYEFPAVRKIGVNLGLGGEFFGMEAMVDDLADISITGGRVYWRPLPFMAIGATGIVDLASASDLSNATEMGDPLLVGAGIDLELFKFSTDVISGMIFADGSALLPIYKTDATDGSGIVAGPQWNAIFYNDELHNFGVAGGIRGNIFTVPYELEYRWYDGIYRPSLFNALYDRNRGTYVQEVHTYLQNQDDAQYENTLMGIYGATGFEIPDICSFEAGYFWPWELTSDGEIITGEDDEITLTLEIMPGIIPDIDLAGTISYTRTKFMPTILQDPETELQQLDLFDENTTLSGELSYPLAEMIDIALLITTAVSRDADGNIIYIEDATTGLPTTKPVITPVFNVETRIHF